jgi:hypothetical protein
MSSSLTRGTDPSSLGGPDVANKDCSRTTGSKPSSRTMARAPGATTHPPTATVLQTRSGHRTASRAGPTPAQSSVHRAASRTSTNYVGVSNRAGTSNPGSSHLSPSGPHWINPSTRGNTPTRNNTPTGRNTASPGPSPNPDHSPIVRSYPSAGSLRAHTPNPQASSSSPSSTGNVARNSNRGGVPPLIVRFPPTVDRLQRHQLASRFLVLRRLLLPEQDGPPWRPPLTNVHLIAWLLQLGSLIL